MPAEVRCEAFLVKFDLKFEISDGENQVKFGGEDFFTCKQSLVVPKPGCFKPGCLQILRPFALICALLRTCVCALLRSFALFCAPLCVSASDRVWERQKSNRNFGADFGANIGEIFGRLHSNFTSFFGSGQMGSYANGVGRILTGFYFFSSVGVHLVPLKTHDFKGVLTGFSPESNWTLPDWLKSG